MSGEYQLLLVIAGMHLLGLGCLGALMLWAFSQDDGEAQWRSDTGSDDGWGNKPLRPTAPSDRPRGGIPLPDAEPATMRLRDHRKLPDLLPRPERRPAREPERAPERVPTR
jgi:hypothetical protein